MADTDQTMLDILYRHLQGIPLSAPELRQYDDWIKTSPHNQQLAASLDDPTALANLLQSMDSVDVDRLWNKTLATTGISSPKAAPVKKMRYRLTWWIAASFLVLLATAAFWWSQSGSEPVPRAARAITDFPPGKNGAFLSLSDGSVIELDSTGDGVIAVQSGSQLVLKNGQLEYNTAGAERSKTAVNMITTPRGRMFQLLMTDGTRVWLNASSSIRFPVNFDEKERRVEITGEAYFKVAKNTRQPFLVAVGSQAAIEVLGTSFNVNAYEDEAGIRTTLLEGSVRVVPQATGPIGGGVILKPGQQAQLYGGLRVLDNVDVDHVMAWKNGFFSLEGMDIKQLMRQLERWYNIEVSYEGNIPGVRLFGKISRQKSLNGFLTALKYYEVNFRMDGKRLVVLP